MGFHNRKVDNRQRDTPSFGVSQTDVLPSTGYTRPVTIHAMSEVNVPTMVIFHNMSAANLSDNGVWKSEATDVGQGIQTARTLIPQRAKDVPLRVMNVMDTDIHMNRGCRRGGPETCTTTRSNS